LGKIWGAGVFFFWASLSQGVFFSFLLSLSPRGSCDLEKEVTRVEWYVYDRKQCTTCLSREKPNRTQHDVIYWMDSVLTRINTTFASLTTCLMVLLSAIALSSLFLGDDPTGELAILSVKVCVSPL
jgi:hypothetical protein